MYIKAKKEFKQGGHNVSKKDAGILHYNTKKRVLA